MRNSLGERRPTEPLRTSYVALHGPARGLRAARAASDVGLEKPLCAGCEVRRSERGRDGLPGCYPEQRPSPAGCHPERSAARRGVEGSRVAPAKGAAVLNPSNLRSATRFGNGKASAAPRLGRDRTLCTIFSGNQSVISEKSLVGFCDSRAKSCIACDLCQGTEHVGLGRAMTVVKTLRESSSRRAIIRATPRKGVLL